MKYERINEPKSPPAKNRKFQTLQFLRNLARNNHSVKNETLDNLSLTDADYDEMEEALFQELIDDGVLEECGGCGCYHRKDFYGDCRNDEERFP